MTADSSVCFLDCSPLHFLFQPEERTKHILMRPFSDNYLVAGVKLWLVPGIGQIEYDLRLQER